MLMIIHSSWHDKIIPWVANQCLDESVEDIEKKLLDHREIIPPELPCEGHKAQSILSSRQKERMSLDEHVSNFDS